MIVYRFVTSKEVLATGLIAESDLNTAIASGQIRIVQTQEGPLLDGNELENVLGFRHDLWRREV